MDLIHTVTRGNRRFIIMRNPEEDMRGFIVEIKRVTPSAVRGESVVEVMGADRFLAETVFIPEDRVGLYSEERKALRFATGRIIKD